jgi:hypothetical protein
VERLLGQPRVRPSDQQSDGQAKSSSTVTWSIVVVHTDLNCLSVTQYAIEVLRVQHIGSLGITGGSLGITEAPRIFGVA